MALSQSVYSFFSSSALYRGFLTNRAKKKCIQCSHLDRNNGHKSVDLRKKVKLIRRKYLNTFRKFHLICHSMGKTLSGYNNFVCHLYLLCRSVVSVSQICF